MSLFSSIFGSTENAATISERDTVQYVLSYKDSTNDRSQKRLVLKEAEYDRAQREGSSSVLEMQKEVIVQKDSSVVRKNPDGQPLRIVNVKSERMVIYSPQLLKVIPEVIVYYPGQKENGIRFDEGVRRWVIDRPFRMLGGALDDLRKYNRGLRGDIQGKRGEDLKKDNPTAHKDLAQTIEHLDILLNEVDKVLYKPIQEEISFHKEKKASFDMLWLLFRPGTEVYTKVCDEWTCCRVYTPAWSSHRADEDRVSIVNCELRMWYLDFDGKVMKRKWHNINIMNYSGTRSIFDLPAYPVRYIQDYDQVFAKLEKRGAKFMDYLERHAPQCQYDGYVFNKKGKHSELSHRQYYEGRVVIDPAYYALENGSSDESSEWVSMRLSEESSKNESLDSGGFTPIDPSKPRDLDPSYYRIFPAYIRGFILGNRRWVWLHLDALEECTFNDKLIGHLQMDVDSLNLIKGYTPALRQYRREHGFVEHIISTDPVSGKGDGRIMLLHGEPGTGKTFTVECISELTKRPLLRLSCKELGLDPVALEEKLWMWFQRAKEWQGILLIDEADIFLRRRGMGDDLSQQAVVVAFLRSLEYYRGNLYLTANIWGKFDDAVLSRISCVIGLKKLSQSQRKTLREGHEARIKSSADPQYEITPDAAKLFAEIDEPDCTFNGRDIRSFYHTVLVLATETHESDSTSQTKGCVTIKAHDVEVVMRNVKELKKFQSIVRKEEDSV